MAKKASNRIPAVPKHLSFVPPGGIPLAIHGRTPQAEVHPLSFIAIDIETSSPPDDVVERVIAGRLLERVVDDDEDGSPAESPDNITTVDTAINYLVAQWQPPRTVTKQETIDAKREEHRESLKHKADNLRDKCALFDEAPIVCIGACGFEGLVVFDAMRSGGPIVEDGVAVIKCGSELDMLVKFRDWLDIQAAPPTDTAAGTALIGFNIMGFDLPKLRGRYLKHGLKPPLALRAGDGERLNPVIDIMRTFLNFCTVDFRQRKMIAFEKVLEHLGLPNYKKTVNGARIPEMYKMKEFAEIVRYNAIDVHGEFAAWALMSGQAQNLT
jgi:hypothetical protein